jgi:hypothetical protein
VSIEHRRRLVRLAITLTTLGLLLAVLPGAVVQGGQRDCSVRTGSPTSEVRHDSLAAAVRAAAPGDDLYVVGTCTGTTVVDRDLRIAGRRLIGVVHDQCRGPDCVVGGSVVFDSGRPVIRSGSSRPALVIAPQVEDLAIEDSVAVRGGLVIGDSALERRRTMSPFPRSPFPRGVRVRMVPRCTAFAAGGHLGEALADPTGRSHMVFTGLCKGQFVIERPLRLTGARLAASSMTAGSGVHRTDSGPPRIRSVRYSDLPPFSVDPSVDHLVLEGFHLSDGFRIGADEH